MFSSSSSAKLLIVDDSREICDAIVESLKALNLQTVIAQSVQEALEKLKSAHYSQFILDLGLPDGDGYGLLNEIRSMEEYRQTPVTILSASTDTPSKLSAFSLGADDYIMKPFNVLELRARVESKMKRVVAERDASENIKVGNLRLEAAKQQVQVIGSGELIRLSPTEFRILAILARRSDVIFSRQQILDQVWGQDVYVNDRTVDTHIYTLRKKLGVYGNMVRSIPGEGYCLSL
jgi:DNA-binding response OmpR family regulator